MKKYLRILLAIAGLALGFVISDTLINSNILEINQTYLQIIVYIVGALFFGILLYLVAPPIFERIEKLIDNIERQILDQQRKLSIIGLFGIIIGIIIAFLLSLPISLLTLPPLFKMMINIVSVIMYYIMAVLGFRFSTKYESDIITFLSRVKPSKNDENYDKISKSYLKTNRKLIDTSVLIDGRIAQIAETGFLEGDIVIPNFVLEELQLIADSADDLKRERGRRGLDIVNELQNSDTVNIVIEKKDYKDQKEVDIKLLKLANETGSIVVTNDYNLNKLAKVQNIKVLNINDLANSVKTVVIPGERMLVNIIKEGKEKKQGLAYLEDGTMIVVEEGKDLIGKEVEVMVTTVLQTSAGKMIFTKVV